MTDAVHKLDTLPQFVLHKPVRTTADVADGVPVGDPTAGGFAYDQRLRCRGFSCVTGTAVGQAEFDLVSADGKLPAVETELVNYQIGDRLRVVVQPLDHPVVGNDLPDGIEDLTVFEGEIVKQPFTIEADGGQENETLSLLAVAAPVTDNLDAAHLVTGRWTLVPGNDTPVIIESFDVPAVFNFRGRPNMMPASGGTVDVAVPSAGGTLTTRVFTHDADEAGEYWTVKEAIKSLLAMFLFGPGGDLPRNIDIEAETLTALVSPFPASGARWEGFDDVLPEVDAHRMGVLDGLLRVCDAAGFELNIMPHYGVLELPDRLYTLSLNRLSAGPEVEVGLQPRRAFSNDPAEILRRNHVSKIVGARDATRLRNEVYTVGRALIEASFELKPLWLTTDVTTDVTDPNYAARHTARGLDFADYQRVGRHWGIDCTGDLAAAPGSYGNDYAHDADGFDFVTALGLNDPGSPLLSDREAQGVDGPIFWMRRVRDLLPLERPAPRAEGIDYLMEVSEDGGGSWARLPGLRVRRIPDQCGLQLLGINDLSRVNLATFNTRETPPLEDSWWKLMFPDAGQPLLRFRVTCCVPADHAPVALANRRAESGSVYTRRVLRPVQLEEVWASPAPGNFFNPAALERIDSWGTGVSGATPERVTPLALAERMRDASEGVEVPCSLYTWLMSFTRWRLGERVTRIAGRNLDLGVSVGDSVRHPSIAGIYVTLSGTGPNAGNAQGVRIALANTSFVEGV